MNECIAGVYALLSTLMAALRILKVTAMLALVKCLTHIKEKNVKFC
jgi:hypothetical protein